MCELKPLSPLSKDAEIKQLSGYPRLKPACILTLDLGTVRNIGTTANGSTMTHVECGSGTLTTAEGYEDRVEGEVVYGADWITGDPDDEYVHPNVRVLIKTDDGKIINHNWSGTGRFSKPIHDMWAGDANVKTFPFGISSTVHSFETGEPKYKHLQHKTFVGNGCFVVHNNPRRISVEGRISEVIASSDMD